MVNFAHVVEGWGKSIGLFKVSEEDRMLSMERLNVCSTCDFAKEGKFLKLLRGDGHEILALYCKKCPSKVKCPVNEKSLSKNEKCPEGLWKS